MKDSCLLAKKGCVLIGIIDLNSHYTGYHSEIGLKPFAFIPGCGAPIGFYILIHCVIRSITAKGGGNHHWLIVIKQHPSREPVRMLFFSCFRARQEMRIIAETCIAPHYPILVKTRRPDTDPPLIIVLAGYNYRAYMPIIIPFILKCGTMACASGKPAGFKGKRIRLRDKIISQGLIPDNH